MELRALGTTGLRVSTLGLGTVKLGRNQGVKYPQPFELPSDQQALALLELAWDLGINLLDTAPAYGLSEERLGRLLRQCRRDWVIVTKVGEAFQNGQSQFDFSAAATRASVERSLHRLGVAALDAVLIHSSGDDLA
ncbi:MAG TPA: aldo/keto reductase, partial [Candidatus Competibacteraceae bacterium]|nr:aldo/keto reductase [Candidatus Competibacteraceae bacterium]